MGKETERPGVSAVVFVSHLSLCFWFLFQNSYRFVGSVIVDLYLDFTSGMSEWGSGPTGLFEVRMKYYQGACDASASARLD